MMRLGDMEVVNQRSPLRITIQERTGESDELIGFLRYQNELLARGQQQTRGPNGCAVGDAVAIKEGIGQGTPIERSPARGVQSRNGVCVRNCGRAGLHAT
jgi:hypothetical protein